MFNKRLHRGSFFSQNFKLYHGKYTELLSISIFSNLNFIGNPKIVTIFDFKSSNAKQIQILSKTKLAKLIKMIRIFFLKIIILNFIQFI